MGQKRIDPEVNFIMKAGMAGKLIADKDWNKHPLGPIETWPQELKSSLEFCIYSKMPIALYWGKSMHLLYNDAWLPFLGKGHPAAMGKVAKEVWTDAWDILGKEMRSVAKSGVGIKSKNGLFLLRRNGFIEETYFDYSINPVFYKNGNVAGLINIANETTAEVLSDRRSLLLRKLSEKFFIPESPEAAGILVANTLSEAPYDIPFGLIYLYNPEKTGLRLVASTLDTDCPIAKHTINLENQSNDLPYRKVLDSKRYQLIENIDRKYNLPGGIWDEPANRAVLFPIIRPNTKEVYGAFLLGLSPRVPFDHHYEVFAKQVAEQTAFAIGNAYDLRRKILMELRQHDAQIQLNTALTSGSIGIWSWDIPTNTVIADKNLAKRFGIGTDEAQAGLPLAAFTDAIHPEDRKWVIERINQSVESKRAFEAEYRIMGSDNKISWVIARGKIETDKDGRPIRFPGVIFDITERKTIEKELARTEEMFKTLFESSIVGVAVQSLDGKIHEANETFLHMLGYTRRDLKSGLTSDMITPPKSRALTANLFRNLKKHGEVDTIEKDYLRKDGSIVPSLMGAVMLQGSSDRFIAFLLDISEQKKLHALNKAKDEFISIASHQLRTPATGVKQYLGMILEGYAGEVNDMQKEILKTAYESNERQLVIVNDLLRVAQADASEISLIKDTINVAQIIQDVINEQAPKFISKNQQIAYTVLPNKSIYARLDPFHIRMAFENLIDNASKYSPKNKPIEIKLRKTTQNIIVSVKDKGVGIRKKDQEKLFKKFSRIDNPLSTVAGGTGLGLYWVHKIVEMHDGEIKVSSEYKKGAEFVITLPIGI